jgi:hypothetical protein
MSSYEFSSPSNSFAQKSILVLGRGFAAGCEARLCRAVHLDLRLGCARRLGLCPSFIGQAEPWA